VQLISQVDELHCLDRCVTVQFLQEYKVSKLSSLVQNYVQLMCMLKKLLKCFIQSLSSVQAVEL